METAVTAVLLLLCLSAPAVSGVDSNDSVLTAVLGSDVTIPACAPVSNLTMFTVTWSKVNAEGGTSLIDTTHDRIKMQYDHALLIRGVTRGDEGIYQCSQSSGPLPQPSNTVYSRYRLLVPSGPVNVSMSILPATALSNGTLIVHRGSTVSFNCSGSAHPMPHLTLAFTGASSSNHSLASDSGTWLSYRIEDVQPDAQGLYSCRAHNHASNQSETRSTQLLVYYAPDIHPECMWTPVADPTHALFNCTWFGAYPAPTLRWGEDQGVDQGGHWKGHVYVTDMAESVSLGLNRSLLSEGQTLRCMAKHMALAPGKERSCSLTLRPPYPQGEPLVTAEEKTSVTLSCTEEASIPPANTTWRKGLQQDVVVSGPKYVLTVEGPVLKLTIHNLTKDDEGVFFCRSENPLNVSELEVYLTVKTASEFTGVIIGIFIAALVVGLSIIVAKMLYSNRHRICLGGGLGQMEDDQREVMSLVDSDDDDEQIFQDAVPRLPPLTNGGHMTLAQIHQIPSSTSDPEDVEPGDMEEEEESAPAEQLVDRITYRF